MPTYVDSSVIVSALIGETRAEEAQELLGSRDDLLSSWLTYVEVRRNLFRGNYKDRVRVARSEFEEQLEKIELVDIGEADWRNAADIAELTRLKSLDAVHVAIANKFNPDDMNFLTFDKKQAEVARQLGFAVVGA